MIYGSSHCLSSSLLTLLSLSESLLIFISPLPIISLFMPSLKLAMLDTPKRVLNLPGSVRA